MKITKTLAIALKKVLSLSLGEIKTDKAVLSFDAEDIAVGTEVYVIDVNGDAQPAEDGEYTCEDGKVIVVAEGIVTEIKGVEAEPEVTVEAEDVPAEPVAEPVAEPETDEAPEEDRVATLEARVAELTEGLQMVLNAMSALEGRIAEIEGKVAKVESEPAEEPVADVAPIEESHTKAYYLRKQR